MQWGAESEGVARRAVTVTSTSQVWPGLSLSSCGLLHRVASLLRGC
jgi:hypothetical protein